MLNKPGGELYCLNMAIFIVKSDSKDLQHIL